VFIICQGRQIKRYLFWEKGEKVQKTGGMKNEKI
jgi:hypothetical protein